MVYRTLRIRTSSISQIARAKRIARIRRTFTAAVAHLVLICGSAVMLLPLLWLISTAFKKTGQEWAFPPVWIPRPIWWRNYLEAMGVFPVPFYRFVLNTLVITVFATLGTAASSSLAAFSFARLRFRARDSCSSSSYPP